MYEDITVAVLTDDGDEALKELVRRRESGETGWDLAEVCHMANPPRTVYRYCVFRINESSETPR